MYATTVPRPEKAYEKHAWIILFALGVTLLGFAFDEIISGAPSYPAPFEYITGIKWSELVTSSPRVVNFISWTIRGEGVWLLVVGVLMTATSLKSYRKAERWSWYAFWIFPLIFALFLARDIISFRVDFFILPLFLIVSLLGLLLPYRKFFPRQQPAL